MPALRSYGDFYGMGHNEMLIREALAGRNGDGVVISLKFGELCAMWPGTGWATMRDPSR